MKSWRRWRKWFVLAVIALVFGICYFVGYAWDLQLSTESGRQRIVHTLWGITIRTENPEDTVISEWVGSESKDEEWLSVASGPVHVALVSYYYPRLYQHFHQLDYDVREESERSAYASFVLQQLRERGNIGSVTRECKEVGKASWDVMIERDLEHSSVTFEDLAALWKTGNGH